MNFLSLLTDNLLLKLISLAFAVVLWIFVMGEQRHEVSHVVPVEYRNLPKGLMIANEVPDAVAVTVSLGMRTLIPGRHTRPEAWIDAADHALYRAKKAGRNRVDAGLMAVAC